MASAADLLTVASKAARASVFIPELADEESPEGWQLMGPTAERVSAPVRAMIEHALEDLTTGIPPEYRDLPAVEEQREKLRGLLDGRRESWPFTIEMRDPPLDGGDDAAGAAAEAPGWVGAFLAGEDGRGSTFHDAPPEEKEAEVAVELGSPASLRRCVIAPGNGCGDIERSNWYGWLAKQLRQEGLFDEVVCRNFPDPDAARRSVWLPFMREKLRVGPDTVVVGHSSGAEAAMRLAEETVVGGLVLVAACHTDLGDSGEAASGYYPPSGGPWRWEAIKKNTGWVAQLHSRDDPLVPVAEGRRVAEELGSEYHEVDGHSHFFEPFEEILEVLRAKTKK